MKSDLHLLLLTTCDYSTFFKLCLELEIKMFFTDLAYYILLVVQLVLQRLGGGLHSEKPGLTCPLTLRFSRGGSTSVRLPELHGPGQPQLLAG